jgi:hypothetical protein
LSAALAVPPLARTAIAMVVATIEAAYLIYVSFALILY